MTSSETGTPQRCSDAEREQTSAVVREAAAEGRLTMAELEERLSAVYAARYRHELDLVSVDLPRPAAARAGWTAVLLFAWHQLTTDLKTLVSRDRTALSRRRKLVLTAVAVVLLVGLASLVVHGFFEDGGPEHHEYGED
jgi:hypothetical protein